MVDVGMIETPKTIEEWADHLLAIVEDTTDPDECSDEYLLAMARYKMFRAAQLGQTAMPFDDEDSE